MRKCFSEIPNAPGLRVREPYSIIYRGFARMYADQTKSRSASVVSHKYLYKELADTYLPKRLFRAAEGGCGPQ